VGRGVPLPTGEVFGKGAELNGEFWCILGLIKPTFDRPGVSICLASSRLGGGAIAPSPLQWIRPCEGVVGLYSAGEI